MFEINLVPSVKNEMIKAMKIRNLVIFVCIMVVAASAGIVVLLAGIAGAQQVAISGQDNRIKTMSTKINNYDGMEEFLTIQGQLDGLSKIGAKKKVLSRIFNVLGVLLPKGEDKISLSELNVNLEESTLMFEGQADAGKEPLIDYRVLESFKKGVALMSYDYGRYVDAKGNIIPARCIKEADENGSVFVENGSVYAIWQRGKKGCNTVKTKKKIPENDEVKIYRTPQFEEWYKKKYLTTSGEISQVPHFKSECIRYAGVESGKKVKWSAENNCKLASEGVEIQDSSNGRDSTGNLVLRFSARIHLNPEIFLFKNKHVMAIGPAGQNVTDSYRQIEGMFAEKAVDCPDGDTACSNNETNRSGSKK